MSANEHSQLATHRALVVEDDEHIAYLLEFMLRRAGYDVLLEPKETLVEVGGYNPEAVGEDMELILHMHRLMKEKRQSRRRILNLHNVSRTCTPATGFYDPSKMVAEAP